MIILIIVIDHLILNRYTSANNISYCEGKRYAGKGMLYIAYQLPVKFLNEN